LTSDNEKKIAVAWSSNLNQEIKISDSLEIANVLKEGIYEFTATDVNDKS
jgi:hypothetical protein